MNVGMTWESKENEHSIVIPYLFIQHTRVFQEWSKAVNDQTANCHQVPRHDRYAWNPLKPGGSGHDGEEQQANIQRLLQPDTYTQPIPKNNGTPEEVMPIQAGQIQRYNLQLPFRLTEIFI